MEHTETLTYLKNDTRRYHRNLIATLLDLRNAAFSEVDHDFIQAVLSLHHIPKDIHNIISDLYKDYRNARGTNDYITGLIKVER